MDVEKFAQTSEVYEGRQHEAVERQEGQHGEPERKLDGKEHEDGNGQEQGKECLKFRQQQHVES